MSIKISTSDYKCILTAALFTTAKTWKQPKCPSKDKQNKMNGIYKHSALKKERVLEMMDGGDGPTTV